MESFDTCLKWLRFQEEWTIIHATTLMNLREKVEGGVEKRESTRWQKKLLVLALNKPFLERFIMNFAVVLKAP